MKKFLIILSIFSCGYMFNDICRELGFTLSEKAYAYGSLDEDDVEDIIEGCKVKYGYIDGYVSGEISNGYVEYGTVYGDVTGTVDGTVSNQKIRC